MPTGASPPGNATTFPKTSAPTSTTSRPGGKPPSPRNAHVPEWRPILPGTCRGTGRRNGRLRQGRGPSVSDKDIPAFSPHYSDATRSSGSVAINAIAKADPWFLTTSADLYSSNKNYLNGGGDFSAENPEGRNFWSASGNTPWPPSAMASRTTAVPRKRRHVLRIRGLHARRHPRGRPERAARHLHPDARLQVAVGEDGPTHQPVETGLRPARNPQSGRHSSGGPGRNGREPGWPPCKGPTAPPP